MNSQISSSTINIRIKSNVYSVNSKITSSVPYARVVAKNNFYIKLTLL